MAYKLEIWRSSGGGTADSDFVLIHTITGATPGADWQYLDSPLTAGFLELYRARYVCDSDSTIVSPWAYIYGRAPYPQIRSNNMGAVVTAARTQIAVGVERNVGQNVQAAYGLDAQTWGFSPEKNVAEEHANRNTVAEVSDTTAAATNLSAPINFSVRPTGASLRMLLAYYKIASTTTVAASSGVPEYYIHKLVPDFTDQPLTIVSKLGAQAIVAAGVRGNTLSLTMNKTQNTTFQAQAGVMYHNWWMADASDSTHLGLLGLSGVTYAVGKYGPTDWQMSFGGVVSGDAQSFGHSLNRNMQAKDVGDNRIGAAALYVEKSTVQMTSSLYFTDDTTGSGGAAIDQVKRLLGHDPSQALPFGISKTMKSTEVRFTITPPLNSDGYSNVFEVVYPVCETRATPLEVPEQGAIMVNLTGKPKQDPANNFADHYLNVTTSETAAALAITQPEILTTPATEFYNYNSVGAASATVPSATSTTASVTGTSLASATTSGYNGLYMQMTTGSAAGEKQAISAYAVSGTTATITTATFVGSRSAGDKFIIVNGYGIS